MGVPDGVDAVLDGVVGVLINALLFEPGPDELFTGFGELCGVVCRLFPPAGVTAPGLGCGSLGAGGVG